MPHQLTRREALLASAMPALGAAAPPANTIPIGMATTQFRDHTNASLAKELSSQGIKTIQLFFTQTDSNYWRYGQTSDLAGLTAGRCREIAGIYRDAGISIHSMGVYATLIHPGPVEIKANLAYFERMMKVGDHMGVHTFVSEAGHYHPPGPAPRIPYDYQDEVWHRTIGTTKQLARLADDHGATVLLEPIYRSIFASAKRTRVFLEEVGSPRIRALLDPANLLEANDLEEMFHQLQTWIDCFHAKDRKLHVTKGVGAGQGDLDYHKFVTLAAERTPGAPLIMEYVGSKDYRQALAHLRRVIREAGIAEA
ncbi:MAG: sugar phosphate isomerase/epimerase [bacterium]|nr:sugar phosphate isomerase/epimerase [bacterium]